METQVEAVWARLLRTCPEAETDDEAKQKAFVHIIRKLEEGWTEFEVFSHMRWAEEFDPHIEEEHALRRMKQVSEAVAIRLAAEKVVK